MLSLRWSSLRNNVHAVKLAGTCAHLSTFSSGSHGLYLPSSALLISPELCYLVASRLQRSEPPHPSLQGGESTRAGGGYGRHLSASELWLDRGGGVLDE
jgi:hypothetical protein